jgi:hypothetical protein
MGESKRLISYLSIFCSYDVEDYPWILVGLEGMEPRAAGGAGSPACFRGDAEGSGMETGGGEGGLGRAMLREVEAGVHEGFPFF